MAVTPDSLRGFVGQLRAVMRRDGVSQRKLAARCGVSQSEISHLLRGVKKNVETATLQRLAEGLGCRLKITLAPNTE